MPLPLLGFKGKRKAGKDTIAKILVERHGFIREAFADELKWEIYCAFGQFVPHKYISGTACLFSEWMTFVDAHKNDPADSEYGWLGPMLQFWGTEYRREKCGPTYWLDKMAPKLGPGVVVTDVRFPNEAALIRKQGGLIIGIERPSLQTVDDGAARGTTHISESGLDGIGEDFIFTNDETWECLPDKVAYALETWQTLPVPA